MIVTISFDSLCVKRLDIKSDECRQGVKKKKTPGEIITRC